MKLNMDSYNEMLLNASNGDVKKSTYYLNIGTFSESLCTTTNNVGSSILFFAFWVNKPQITMDHPRSHIVLYIYWLWNSLIIEIILKSVLVFLARHMIWIYCSIKYVYTSIAQNIFMNFNYVK